MPNYKIEIATGNETFITLQDILPETNKKLKILFVAKVPAPISVDDGHYFQGKQGKTFWNLLKSYGIINVPAGDKADEHLIEHGYGIIDIVKKPKQYSDEPTKCEYLMGMNRIIATIEKHRPEVIVFVYKGVLDKIMKYKFGFKDRSTYGFNDDLNDLFSGSRVFVFPMPGTPCTKEKINTSMLELENYIMK